MQLPLSTDAARATPTDRRSRVLARWPARRLAVAAVLTIPLGDDSACATSPD